ncbi:AcrR family transcriptional regulator [Marmoricola sp. URHA0025 HA25]
MTSLRHKGLDSARPPGDSARPPGDSARPPGHSAASPADLALDAAREAILAVGWSRTTLTDVARRAGVSRMTIYRNWPDMRALLADLMTREWSALVQADTEATNALDRLVRSGVATVRAIRANPLFARVVELDPELLLPYLLDRPGRSQRLVIEVVADQVRAGQATGEVRDGDPELLARSVVLACHGFTLSTQTMTGAGVSEQQLDDELAVLLERYLRP